MQTKWWRCDYLKRTMIQTLDTTKLRAHIVYFDVFILHSIHGLKSPQVMAFSLHIFDRMGQKHYGPQSQPILDIIVFLHT